MRVRRGGRRPGWLLLTVLLALAIVASSALVFTNRVELLKLAVILALWAAVVAAFVSVIYRRQSDIDQAKARDLKLVYDLQLDREISARREYELTVESELRRELSSEIRAQAADEVAALRAELAALRANLEIHLRYRPQSPAGDRDRTRAGDWTRDTTTMPPVPGRVQSSRITPVRPEDTGSRPVTAENPIIDVPEEPLVPPHRRMPRRRRAAAALQPAPEPDLGGSHRRPSENGESPSRTDLRATPVAAAGTAIGRRGRGSGLVGRDRAATVRSTDAAPAREAPEWRPVDADGKWLPPGAPGSNWVANADSGIVVPSAAAEEPRGRHWTPPQEAPAA